jgi:hypothetical protein
MQFEEYGEVTTVEVDHTAAEPIVTKHWDLTDPKQQWEFDLRYHFECVSIYDITERKGVRTFWWNDKATVFCSDDPIALAAQVEQFLETNK